MMKLSESKKVFFKGLGLGLIIFGMIELFFYWWESTA